MPEAENIYQQILQTDPDQPDALHLLGLIALQMGKSDIAVDLITKALAIKPEFIEAHYNLGNAFLAMEKPFEAIASYEKTLAIKPDYAEAHNNLGAAFQKLGRLDEAVASFHNALAIKPDYANAHGNLGAALGGLGKLNEAAIALRTLIDLEPGNADLHMLLHAILYDQNDIKKSADALSRAINANPDRAIAHFYRGMIHDQQGDPESAEREFAHVIRLDDRYSYQLDSWDYVKRRSGPSTRLFANKCKTLDFAVGAAMLDGLVLEFGVRFGVSIRFIAAKLDDDVHGFDSFQGLPEPWEDQPVNLYTTQGNLPDVPSNVHLHVGLFADTLPEFLCQHTGAVRFINMDCDIYSSTKTVFDAISDRIVPGTVIVFDEYICNPRWRQDEHKAFQEAVERNQWNYEYLAFSPWSKQAVVKIL